jgi:hypothetical protein
VQTNKVGALKAEAKRLFSDTYSEYDKMQALCNISFSTENRTDPELHLVAAEAAFATKDVSVAKTIVTRYLVMGPQEDQFYCRAKLLYAEILDWEATRINGVDAIAEAKRSMAEVSACLDVATKPENSHRYKVRNLTRTNCNHTSSPPSPSNSLFSPPCSSSCTTRP